jgi:HEPN domain-containing protein
MSLIKKIGPDTISRLERAASRRLTEAEWLAEGKHYLAAIYLAGYAAEMVIGAAYFRVLGYGSTEPINDKQLGRVLQVARLLSHAEDKSHPLDGLARLLVQDKGALSPPAYDKKMERTIVDRASLICEHWGPKLRYRAIDATPDQVSAVLRAARWFLDHFLKI